MYGRKMGCEGGPLYAGGGVCGWPLSEAGGALWCSLLSEVPPFGGELPTAVISLLVDVSAALGVRCSTAPVLLTPAPSLPASSAAGSGPAVQ